MTREDSRICREVQGQLPSYVDRSLPRLRRRLVGLHLRRCPDCQAEFARQREVSEGLAALAGPPAAPPEGLLTSLLDQAANPGVKGRVAVPARLSRRITRVTSPARVGESAVPARRKRARFP